MPCDKCPKCNYTGDTNQIGEHLIYFHNRHTRTKPKWTPQPTPIINRPKRLDTCPTCGATLAKRGYLYACPTCDYAYKP